ncbi:SDR family NAD(P)-dependent oxidoreductase [Catenovulum sediminis]|uniref:SDR family NAD(P)-dependent oxidoreductase n=1 Tax=Catenovulum sediminis TaxID=1740262 RepID=UPI00117FA3B8|nr:SDR family NAD(P)-dependent oxidoreductase [Catenovulum sediminis]
MSFILITGANRGIGLHLCRHYLSQGQNIIALARSHSSALEALQTHYQTDQQPDQSGQFKVYQCDLNQEESIQQVAESIKLQGIELELVIHNAGVSINESFGNWTQKAFIDNYRVNAVAPALLTQALFSQFAHKAKIILFSSGVASLSEAKDVRKSALDSYAMSKVALNMLAVKLSNACDGVNAICCAINPGWVRTDMGGQDATQSPEETVISLTQTIANLSEEKNASFLSLAGEPISW